MAVNPSHSSNLEQLALKGLIAIIVVTSTPVVRTGVYPHMPIADHCETQIVYNTGRHRPCGGLLFTAHMVCDGGGSLSHPAHERRKYNRFFNF